LGKREKLYSGKSMDSKHLPPGQLTLFALLSDGKERTVHEIKKELDLPENKNVNLTLMILKSRLIYDRMKERLKVRTKDGRAGERVWRMVTKEENE
jgi:hypothetical protein